MPKCSVMGYESRKDFIRLVFEKAKSPKLNNQMNARRKTEQKIDNLLSFC